ncbi:MAG TPA: hypothetical protein VK326_05135 [Solirubrobacterales bacterium]|nr:hypothetical protein [Solirubrobacterales bacterium]
MDHSQHQLRRPRIGAVIAVAALVGLPVWIAVGGADDSTPAAPPGTPPVATSEADETLLTVGTYRVEDAYGVVQRQAEQPGSLTSHTPDGGFVVTNESNLTSVYIAYHAQDLELEVYDPDPKRAFKLATSGEIVPVG